MRYILCMSVVGIMYAQNLADPSKIKPLKDFVLPEPIVLSTAQSYMLQNQFDKFQRNKYYYVTDKIDDSTDIFHISSGFYGKNFYDSALVKYKSGKFYTLLNTNFTKANGYKDGKNKEVDFGYERFGKALVFGYLPNTLSELKFSFMHDDINNDKQPQHLADAIKTKRYGTKFNARIGQEDLSDTLNLEVSYKNINRKTNNFDLRNYDKNKMIFTKVDRKVFESKVKYDYDFKNFHSIFGIGFMNDWHEGKRYKKTPFADVLNAYRFADLNNKSYSVFNTIKYEFNDSHIFTLGFNYEYINSKARKADAKISKPVQAGGGKFPNPKSLWKKYYDIDFDGRVNTDGFSMELQYDFIPTYFQKYSLNFARIARIANNTERFSSLSGDKGNGIVSNPNIKKEIHNYLKMQMDFKNEFYNGYLNSLVDDGLNFGGYVYVDRVKDLIIFDRARSQKGIFSGDGTVISRNVDAVILSTGLYTNYNFDRNFGLSGKVFYNYGQNSTDKRPLYQIRPFEADLNLDYKDYFDLGSFNIGTAFHYVGKQTRGDWEKKDGLGIDLKQAAGDFFIADIYAGVNFMDKYGLRFGINNVFDKEYAWFISGNHVTAMSPNVVNAPGRMFWLSIHAVF